LLGLAVLQGGKGALQGFSHGQRVAPGSIHYLGHAPDAEVGRSEPLFINAVAGVLPKTVAGQA